MKLAFKSKKVRIFGAVGVVILLFLLWKLTVHAPDLPAFTVQKGDFLIPLTTKGELKAIHSISITVPRLGGISPRITRMVPEGTVVKKGDFLVQFDPSELLDRIHKRENELKNALAELRKLKADIESRQKELESELEIQHYSYQQAKLQLKQMEFESEARRRDRELAMKKAEISLKQAQFKLKSQKLIDEAALEKARLAVDQARSNLSEAQKNLKALTILAPADGLVVYNLIWGPSGRQKVKIGDMPWPGQAILEIPDLSQMKVATSVNEVDIDRVKKGQPVEVSIEALPGTHLTGHVTQIATLAHSDDVTREKVFDVTVTLDSTVQQLKPGMSATCKIVTDRLKDVLTVPVEAVFEKGGKSIVYVLTPRPKPREVVLGPTSKDFVVVKHGLKPGEKVSLLDPTKPIRELGKEMPASTKPKKKRSSGGGGGIIIVR